MQPAFLGEFAADSVERLDLDDFLPHRLSMSSRAVSALVSRAYRDRFGLTPAQWRVMSLLAERGDQPLGALAAHTLMDRATAVRAAESLARRGLAEAGASARLTVSGEALYAEIAPLVRAYEAALTAGLAPTEVRLLKRLLLRLEGAAASLAGEAEPPSWEEA